MKKVILFDHDGVLVDTEPWYYEATRRCIAPLGVSLELPQYLDDMANGRTAWEHARRKGVSEHRIVEQRAKRDVLYQQFLVEKDIEIAGVEVTLATLARQYRLAIVTTAKKPDFELIHAERNIVSHMEFVLANGDYARSKPEPDPYLAALERAQVDASEAVVVEDSERGLRSAVAAGIDCVVVHNAFVVGQDFTAARAHIRTLDELPGLIATL